MTTNPEITNTRKKWLIRGGVAAVVVVLIVGAAVMFVPKLFQNTITAYFPATTGLYSGDDVRVLGVKVGTIDSIEPGADFARVTMNVKKSVEIPADAKAVIVAPSLVSGRFVQLTPVYAGGPTMGDGASIPVERTAVPVEWDEIKTELNKLSEALGPQARTRRLARHVHRHRRRQSRRQRRVVAEHAAGIVGDHADPVRRPDRPVLHHPQPADVRGGSVVE